MSKMYLLLIERPYEGEQPLGIYATKDDAEDAAKVWWTTDKWNASDYLWISEYVVGAAPATESSAGWKATR